MKTREKVIFSITTMEPRRSSRLAGLPAENEFRENCFICLAEIDINLINRCKKLKCGNCRAEQDTAEGGDTDIELEANKTLGIK